jgi:hypothetical protein
VFIGVRLPSPERGEHRLGHSPKTILRRRSGTRHFQSWTSFSVESSTRALLEAGSFEDLPGRWQAAILEAEQNRPELRVVTGD